MLISTLAAGLCLQAQAADHHISGLVIDRNGNPVGQAMITLTHQDEDEALDVQLVTDREGRFLVDYLRNNEGEREKLDKKADYAVEVYKPGYHTQTVAFYYKKGIYQVQTVMLTEETVSVQDDDADLDPAEYDRPTQSSGATYEGQ